MEFMNDRLLVEESLYSTANGYIGIRGNFEEGYPEHYDTIRGTYINGFYDEVDIVYGENAFGFPQVAQKMVNVIDAQGIRLCIDGDWFSVFDGTIHSYERDLDIHRGFSYRKIDWTSPKGHRLVIEFKRMVSFVCSELALFTVKIQSINYSGLIEVISSIEGEVENYVDQNDPRVGSHRELLSVDKINLLDTAVVVEVKTKRSGLSAVATVGHKPSVQTLQAGNRIEGIVDLSIEVGETIDFSKYVVYTDSIRHKEPMRDGLKLLDGVMALELTTLFQEQEAYLNDFWHVGSIEIQGSSKVEEAVNYSVYQLLSSAGRKEFSQISAKGLSGEGYEGHYFWDTEIYLMPLFSLTQPELAKRLLSYRHETLEAAKERAFEMGHKNGAKIPWRTISGTECSGFFPAGSAQYHINADVAYAMIQYYLITDDLAFIEEKGFEVIFETARIWMDMGNFDLDNRFNINAVTGPDEYTAIVNNNYYTNAMAKYHLEWVGKLKQRIKDHDKGVYKYLKNTLKIEVHEIYQMSKAAECMCLPYDETLGINLQDEGFLQKEAWDFDGTDASQYPLLLHFHPLTIYRAKVLKQADTVLAHFLLDNEAFEQMEKTYNYYEKLTTHDSSLSPCVHSMMAARIGAVDKAYDYYMDTLFLDIDNLHHNTKDGLHIANAGGAYMGIIYGFGGLRIKEDGLYIRPIKPKQWPSIKFSLYYRGQLVTITLGEKIVIDVETDISIHVYDTVQHIVGRLEVDYDG